MLSGIKQGLPLSPYQFLFDINDIFDFFYALYDYTTTSLLEKHHVLVHADDANIIASSCQSIISNVSGMVQYFRLNKIQLQLSKCMFMVINGSNAVKQDIELNVENIPSTDNTLILGTPLTDSGKFKNDLDMHLEIRFKICIKFFNFIRANRLAPVPVKLKVLSACVTSTLLYNCETFGNDMLSTCVTSTLLYNCETFGNDMLSACVTSTLLYNCETFGNDMLSACVASTLLYNCETFGNDMLSACVTSTLLYNCETFGNDMLSACVASTLLYNCETFGNDMPKGLETIYFKLIKSTLNVRLDTPNDIVLIESGLLPLGALVQKKRQLKFYRKFKKIGEEYFCSRICSRRIIAA